LPSRLDVNAIKTTIDKRVLTAVVPKPAPAQAKTIGVTSAT
jgi:hypothetical protein